jgi:hypothetical protein
VVADTALKVGETSLVTITFSEAVTGFTNADLTIANGTLSAVSSRWRHHLDGDLHADRSITDTTNLITLDNTGVADLRATPAAAPPTRTTTPSTPAPDRDHRGGRHEPAAGETSLVTITFSEAVTGFTNADLTVANGTLSGPEQQRRRHHLDRDLHADRQHHRHHQPDHPGQHRRHRPAGNAGSGTNSNNYAIDTARRPRPSWWPTTR